MFETLFKFSGTIARHRDGPFAAERERYLAHCAGGGGTETTRRVKAACILWVAERMAPADAGRVAPSRLREIVDGHAPAVAPNTADNLISCARPWLKYLGWWYEPKATIPFEGDLDRFVAWMRDERGLTPCTVEQWRYRTANFLSWWADTGRDLAALRPEDIDSYFVTYGA